MPLIKETKSKKIVNPIINKSKESFPFADFVMGSFGKDINPHIKNG